MSNDVKGDIAEVGVYKRNFASSIDRVFLEREFYLFDTFDGFNDRDMENEDELSVSFCEHHDHKNCTPEEVINKIVYSKRVVVKKGDFLNIVSNLEERRFAFVSLNTDLYKSIKAGLNFFWEKMALGGYIFVDGLGHPVLLGVRKAIVELCKKRKIGYVMTKIVQP